MENGTADLMKKRSEGVLAEEWRDSAQTRVEAEYF